MNSEQRLTMIRRLSDAYGVSGFEDLAAAEARGWIIVSRCSEFIKSPHFFIHCNQEANFLSIRDSKTFQKKKNFQG